MEWYNEEENGDGLPPHSWRSMLTSTTAPEILNDCYDCNICLDNAQDPVVTLCGHLFCWPCIYKWLNSEFNSTTTPEDQQQQQCPVCKSVISKTTLVPLYGRGQTKHKEKESFIPRRPKASGVQALITTSTTSTPAPPQASHRYHSNQPPQHLQLPQNRSYYYHGYGAAMPTTPSGLHPMVGMLAEMVYKSLFGNTQAHYYWYPDSYQHITINSPRIRWQDMQAEKYLNRISIFLFCCFVLCLLLF